MSERPELLSELERVGTPIKAGYIVDERMRTLRKYPAATFGIAVAWSRLHDVLLRRLGYDNVRFGKRLAEVSDAEDQAVQVTFEDGTRVTADVLLGADGIRSTLYDRGPKMALRNFVLKHLPQRTSDHQIGKILDMDYLDSAMS